jgi:hypothetical protein
MFHLYIMACGGHLKCDGLSSTPLNECIGTADLIVNRFKARSKVQIVNTIFLTDGESDPIGEIHGVSTYGARKNRKFILQDDVTKKNYDIRAASNNGWNRYSPYADKAMTTLLLRILKERTGCNLIGFFISSYGFESMYRQFYGEYGDTYKKCATDWKENGFFGVTTAGYDEYYILNPKSMNVSSGNLNVNSDMSKRKIASEFIKFSEKKSVSRVLLSRFVKRIAA